MKHTWNMWYLEKVEWFTEKFVFVVVYDIMLVRWDQVGFKSKNKERVRD